MAAENTLRKVVVRTLDGRTVPGFARMESVQGRVSVLTSEGKEREFELQSLKAVFFVRDFEGDPKYDDVKFLDKHQAAFMVWARVEFFDGEVLEGKVQNNKQLLLSPGFYLWPSDPDTNNQCVYVSKTAVTDFTILSPV